MNLDWLLGLPRSGVVILRKQSQVLISYTTSMGANLESLYNQFGGHRGVTMEVVSAGADLETLKLHTEYYRSLYGSSGGYTLLQSHLRKAVSHRVRVVPSPDLKVVDVEIVTARGDSKIVGKFKNTREASEFIETYYGTDNQFKFPVYAVNADTKALLLHNHKKILDIK